MDDIVISIEAGHSKTLLTKDKACDRNIVVKAGDNYSVGYNEGYKAGEEVGFWDGYGEGASYGHETGYQEGYDDGYSTGWPTGYANGESDGIAIGRDLAYNAFWDAFQANGTRTSYVNVFAGLGWTDDTYNPKYTINATSHAGGMFNYCTGITSTKVAIVIDNIAANTSVFANCSRLKTIPSLKVTDTVKSYSEWFYGCSALEEINFTEDSVVKANISFASSPLLTTASVDSIIHALKDLTGATTQTLTLHATVGGKLTQAQKDAIDAKNWTLVY